MAQAFHLIKAPSLVYETQKISENKQKQRFKKKKH